VSHTDHHVPAKYRQDLPPRPHFRYGRAKRGNPLAAYVNHLWRSARTELRIFTVSIKHVHRSGGDIEELGEPDARMRHGAHRDMWP